MKPGPATSAGLDQAFGLRIDEQGIDDLLRELARIGAQRLGELHRDVARDVAVRGDFRALKRDGGRDEGGFSRALRGSRDLLHRLGEQCFECVFVCGQHACCESSEAIR
ncbi:hypothetical protein OKW42_005166 [Paraburkholderia sp. WC7.3d]